MRILRVAQTLYPDVTGGGAYHVHAMSRDQAAMGHDVTVLTIRRRPDQPRVEERDGYTVRRFDAAASPLGNELSPGLAKHLWTAEDYDVLHAHSHLYASTNVAALRRWVDGHSGSDATPLAITNHGLYSQTAPEWVFDGYLQTIGRWTFDRADVVFCYTDVDERRLRDLGVSTDVAVVPNGVDTERFRPEGPESEALAAGGMAVLFVGRLVDGKRPQDAVAAMEAVRSSYPDATLYCCGDGPLRGELERRASGDLDGAVEFLGHVDYDEMPVLYRAADLLVLPSRAEGMPRTVLEARAAGTPVVTTDLDHLAAVEDDAVRTVPVEAVDELAAAITATLADHAGEPSEPTASASSADPAGSADEAGAGTAGSRDRPSAVSDGGDVAVDGAYDSVDGGEVLVDDPASDRDGVRDENGDGVRGEDGDGVRGEDGDGVRGEDGDGVRSEDGDGDRAARDWETTVRRTTRVLERLTERRD